MKLNCDKCLKQYVKSNNIIAKNKKMYLYVVEKTLRVCTYQGVHG